jgi:hypothetical protein
MNATDNQILVGSIPLDNTMTKIMTSKVNVSLNNAITIAEKSTDINSHAVSANLGIQNGFIVYTIWVVDPNNNFHKVIVDPGNGNILSTVLKQPGNKVMKGLGVPMQPHHGQGPHGKGLQGQGQIMSPHP